VDILGNITVNDNRTLAFDINSSFLALGQNVTGKATYTIKQSELNNGSVTNSVYTIGVFNNDQVVSDTVNATVNATQNPALNITKEAYPTSYDHVGELITYYYNINNTGNVAILGNIKVYDNITGTFNLPSNDLEPGQTVNVTENYTIKQSDLNNGSVTNSASATNNATNSNIVNATVNATQRPALNITKETYPTSYSAVGDLIIYTYTVNNTGNVDILGNIMVTDDQIPGPISISNNDLAPGQNVTGIATYSVTLHDLDVGHVTNSANATGTNGLKSNNTTATITAINQHPALNITKSASPSSYGHVGELITYTYTVNNIGNVNIPEPITVYDNKIPGGQITIGVSGSVLAQGASVQGMSTYTITQADLDAGSVTNSAFATGPNNTVISNNTNVTILAIQKPDLKIEKVVSPITYFTVGDLIEYLYTVTNKGNVDISEPITVTDNMFGSSKISSSDLALGQNVKGFHQYYITPRDINVGFVINSAYAFRENEAKTRKSRHWAWIKED
jgi:uncharacterized repeat protein (TIGR01451 family)